MFGSGRYFTCFCKILFFTINLYKLVFTIYFVNLIFTIYFVNFIFKKKGPKTTRRSMVELTF